MKKLNRIVAPFVVAFMVGLSACNMPLLRSSNVSSAAQTQTQISTEVAQQVGQYLTQTAQSSGVIYITATPQPGTAGQQTATPAATVVPPTATTVPVPCNQAGWVTDVTIPDGTNFIAGTTFVKTWRLRNTGSCTWNNTYSIVFVSGNSMGAAASTPLTGSIAPGQTVDISVPMVAPVDKGSYTGTWMLREPNGSTFGTGPSNEAVTVQIAVTTIPAPKDPNTVYDFVGNYCAAQWRTNAGFITCPSAGTNFTSGSITRSYSPILENGLADDEGAIITIPASGSDGMVQGQYPAMTIHSGDHFMATLLCSYKQTNCSATYEVLAQEQGSSTIVSLGTWKKVYDNTTISVNLDLSSFDGKNMIFYLKVSSGGNSTDDYAQWMAARISHASS